MNVKVENVEKNVVQLEIEVDAQKFAEGMQKSFQKNAKHFNIPGFRKGKATRAMVERHYGEQALYEDAINAICPEAYDKAVEQEGLDPVDRPEIDVKQIGNGQNFIFTAKVTLKPEVVLGDYKLLEVTQVKAMVTEEEVEKEIEKVAEKNARLVTIEDRGVQTGDTAIINFEGFVDGVAFEGGKGENHNLVIGSGQFIPGFEEQLIGVKTGEEVDVNVTFPEDYNSAELAGKPTLFKVKLNEIKYKELPAIDDEFAKDISEFENLEDYKADLRKKLLETAETKAKRETEDNVVKMAVGNAEVEIPNVMVEKQIDNIAYDFDMRLRYQGLDLQKYLEMMGMDTDTFRIQFKERALNEVRSQLVLEKISKVEDIKPTEEELETELKKFAENYKQDIEEFKKHLKPDDIEYIRDNLTVRKTVDFLVENANLI